MELLDLVEKNDLCICDNFYLKLENYYNEISFLNKKTIQKSVIYQKEEIVE
jgi:hypothetical protein